MTASVESKEQVLGAAARGVPEMLRGLTRVTHIGWWGGFLVVEQHVPSGGGAVENEQEVMEAHQGLQVVVVQVERGREVTRVLLENFPI